MRREHARRFAAGVFTLALVACQTAGTSLAPPIVHLADLRVKDVRLFEQRYTLALRIENPNPQELPIWGMAYRMSLNDVELGGGVSRAAVTVPPYGETMVQVDLVSNVFSLIERVRDLAAHESESLDFALSGNFSVTNRSQPLPFSLRGQLGRGKRS